MTTPEPSSGGGGGNVFTRKIGPLPMWVWMLIALVAAVGFYLVESHASSSSASSGGTASDQTGQSTTDASLVPQFVNQTYVNNTPPPSPSLTPSKTVTTTEQDQTKQYSWFDTGQGWSATELAKKLGVSLDDLKATNALGKKALQDPNKPIAKGAHFTYDKGPTGVTTGKTTTTKTPAKKGAPKKT